MVEITLKVQKPKQIDMNQVDGMLLNTVNRVALMGKISAQKFLQDRLINKGATRMLNSFVYSTPERQNNGYRAIVYVDPVKVPYALAVEVGYESKNQYGGPYGTIPGKHYMRDGEKVAMAYAKFVMREEAQKIKLI